jgi:hypothetical protein
MANIQDGRATAGLLAIENVQKAARTVVVPRSSRNFSLGASTGTMAAGLAAGAPFFAMRLSPTAGAIQAYIERVRIQFTTIVAFTTPVTAGRRIALYRGSTAAASGGTAIADFTQKDPGSSASQCAAGQGGDVRIATTATLTATGILWETTPIREMTLSHVGASGGFFDCLMEFAATESAPIILQPGQLLGIRPVATFDAAGTWQASINVDWHEALALSSTTADS